MGIGISTIIIIIIAFFILKSIVSFSLKVIGLGLLIGIAAFTIWICTAQPDLHKPFSLSTIEYLFKINKDGSVTSMKQTTQSGVVVK